MRALLDTQLIIWWLTDDRLRMPQRFPEVLAEYEAPVYVSRASQWEMAIKVANGKLKLDLPRFTAQVTRDGFDWLEIESPHVLAVVKLPKYDDHKDPFDRLLVAQSLTEPLILLTTDPKLARYGATVKTI